MAGASLLDIIDILPQLMLIAQTVMYFVLAWVFGSLAFRGMKKHISFLIKIIAMLGTGFVCLIVGTVLKNYILFFRGTIFESIQLDLFLGGLISSIAFAFALYMITHKEEKTDKDTLIKKLQERVNLLRGILLKNHAPTLKEDKVRKTAETLVPGFTAIQANLKGADWEILLKKDDKKAVVMLGAYTGEVKKIEHDKTKSEALFSDPLRIAGIGIILFLIGFSFFSFHGFPNMLEGVASLFGMTPDEFNMLMGIGDQNLPEGCVSATRLLMKQGVNIMGGKDSYLNEDVRGMIENATNKQVVLMYKADFEGKEYILSVTLPQELDFSQMSNDEIIRNADICSSTEEIFCDCIHIPDLNVPTGFIIAV
jgi:uncharacterized membrane protein YkoI